MKKFLFTKLFLVCVIALSAETFPIAGKDSVRSDFFREWYQNQDLRHYLDNMNDYTIYQTETTGEWGNPDQLVFSIHGNDYRWNRYLFDDMHIDSRAESGSTPFYFNMQQNNLLLDYYAGSLSFTADSSRLNQISAQYNIGGIGGIMPGTRQMINLFHQSATERNQDGNDLSKRNHLRSAGTIEAGFNIKAYNKQYYQHVYATIAERGITYFDQRGTAGMYNALNWQLQLDGELPMPQNKVIDKLGYLFSVRSRQDWGEEFVYNKDEVAQRNTYSLALYGKKKVGQHSLTTGLLYQLTDTEHRDSCFARNVIDQDGEGFEPWYASGNINEINWSVKYKYQPLKWLSVNVDALNTLLHFNPHRAQWHNDIYYQQYLDAVPTPLYQYRWQSRAFTSGMLENTATVDMHYQPTRWLVIDGKVGISLDGMVLGDNKSIISPNWLANVSFNFKPTKWFEATIALSKERAKYSWEDVCFLSSDYMNVDVYYASGNKLSNGGGKYHSYNRYLRQPSYFIVDLPFRFTLGRHEISFLQSISKHFDTWQVYYAQQAEDYGFYQDYQAEIKNEIVTNKVFFENNVEKQYVVDYEDYNQLGKRGSLFRTPTYFSSVIKYAYNGKHVLFSLSWQSYLMTGLSSLGNGVVSNNVGHLSETTASPNNHLNITNTNGAYRSFGRLDQDRAYVLRMLVGCNFNEHWQLAFSAKFKDGTPFCNFGAMLYTNAENDTQVAVFNYNTKGINQSAFHFGMRKDAFFNMDLRLAYKNTIGTTPIKVQAVCYNFFDFGTELFEYCFGEQLEHSRRALTLNIPRGLMLNLTVGI